MPPHSSAVPGETTKKLFRGAWTGGRNPKNSQDQWEEQNKRSLVRRRYSGTNHGGCDRAGYGCAGYASYALVTLVALIGVTGVVAATGVQQVCGH